MKELKTEQKIYDHFMFFLFIISSFAFSYIVVLILSTIFDRIYPTWLFDDIVYLIFPFYVVALMILIPYLFIKKVPFLKIKNYPSLAFQIVIILILASNFSIKYNRKFFLNWLFKEFIDAGLAYVLFANFIFYALAVFSISRILYDPKVEINPRLYKVVRMSMLELSIMLLVAFLSIQVIFSFYNFGMQNFDLTAFTRILLVLLFAMATSPEMENNEKSDDQELKTDD